MPRRPEVYKASAIKRRGKDYYRLWSTVGTKRLVEWETHRLKADGVKYFVERFGGDYRIWYRPGTQDIARRDYQRFKARR